MLVVTTFIREEAKGLNVAKFNKKYLTTLCFYHSINLQVESSANTTYHKIEHILFRIQQKKTSDKKSAANFFALQSL